MDIPANIILLWPSTIASIPTNWARETSLDGKFPKAWGASVAPNNTGGASTHTHTSPTHTHSIAAHTHTGTTSACVYRDSAQTNSSGGISKISHTHPFTTGAIASSNNFGSTAVTYGAVSNNPPYYDLIAVKAQNGAILQDSLIALWTGFDGDTDTPPNWQYCNGSNSSPDLRNKYIRGAGTGANAGGTGGSTTNVHDITHGHTGASHTQAGFNTSGYNGSGIVGDGGSCCSVVYYHTHTYSATDAETVTPNNYSGSLTTTETVEPAYKKVGAIQRKAGGIKERGLIGLWLGAIADIPSGWKVCDGTNGTTDLRDKFIKIATDASEFGNTGGANTHVHGAQAHVHTTPTHRHYVNQAKQHYGMTREGIGSGPPGNEDQVDESDTHPAFYTDYATPNTTSANTTADSSANQPEYRTVAYIQYQFPSASPAFIFADL